VRQRRSVHYDTNIILIGKADCPTHQFGNDRSCETHVTTIKKLISGALLCAAALLPVAATAQPVQGLYVGLGAGANFAGDLLGQERTKSSTPPSDRSA
jgi:hypothetical protein